jgi:hypothetical protein
MILYSKVAMIRDKQKEMKKRLEEEIKEKDQKLFLQMELERLRGMEAEEQAKISKKIVQTKGAKVVIHQMENNKELKIKHKEYLQKEKEELNNRLIIQDEKENKKLEEKLKKEAILAKEMIELNREFIENKKFKKEKEKELDRKLFKYNMEKIRKEEEDLLEKKKISDIKEKETQKMRDKQEKTMDKNSDLDQFRANRAFEENERNIRLKERKEAKLKHDITLDLIESNVKQKLEKEQKFYELIRQEKVEYERIKEQQFLQLEGDKRKEKEKLRQIYEHNQELK